MNVAIGSDKVVARRVSYDPRTDRIEVELDGIVADLRFAEIPDDEFESRAPVVGFSLRCEGTVVVCRHQDGAETWFPVDMWLPGGFVVKGSPRGGARERLKGHPSEVRVKTQKLRPDR